jgi:hypothetical protein
VKRRKLGPVAWAIVDDDGTELGRYGGRDGARWAQRLELVDGELVEVETVTEDSPLSAGTVRSLLESAIRRAQT